MKKMLKKSEVLKEGYIKGLKEAQRIIYEMLDEKSVSLLDPTENYTYKEIAEWLDANDANWDSLNQTEEGTLLQGDFLIYVNGGVEKWLYAKETYLNEWSSCYKIEYFDTTEDVPQELWDKAEAYLDWLDSRK